MASMTDAFADKLEPDLAQFEINAGMWRLEADRHLHRLREDAAIGIDPVAIDPARVTLEGIGFEIDRIQAFARDHIGIADTSLLRLAEVGLALETARRRLVRALTAQPQS